MINSGEVLTKEGIHGSINKTGVGFGTGRHTSSRKELVEIPETKILDKKSTQNLDKPLGKQKTESKDDKVGPQ